MSPPRATSRFRYLAAVAAALAVVPFASPAGAQSAPPAPCDGAGPYRDFDFWVGAWDVFLPDGRQAGTNRIERAERGCLLVEHWTGAGGGTGTSMNYYDPAGRRWNQLWVSSNGVVITIDGGLRDGAMALAGELIDADGTRQPFRGTWTPAADGSVRQHFEISSDGGGSWVTWFDGRYVRREEARR